MNKNELLERINSKGRVLGYPLFVMEGGQILKTPPQDVPFKLVVWDEIDVNKSLNNQKLMSYSQWLGKTRPAYSMSRSVYRCKFEEKYNISHLKPKIYRIKDKKVYVYAEDWVLYYAKKVKANTFWAEALEQPKGEDRFYIFLTPWQDVKAEQWTVEQGKETYYYLH